MSQAPEARKPASLGKLAVLMVTAFMDMVGRGSRGGNDPARAPDGERHHRDGLKV
ncbi:MAG TPA: hypothetical protein VGQ75_07335 [Thermoanaerobaculia bacterium]|nr:hypothetical protein [Thermoanaerobaculia bacterium]HEV8609456.1 hypothetical protein [Thermoanaerobaculia bacterium]